VVGGSTHSTPSAAIRGYSASASSAGGCIVLTLAPPCTPTASAPDPEANFAVHPVQVGGYRGHHPVVTLQSIAAAIRAVRPACSYFNTARL
jgi:hypothetical protein